MAEREYVAPVLSYAALDPAHLPRPLLELPRKVGVDKVTMRALAAHAGTSPSSVYYRVKDKSELLDLLIETVVESIEVPTTGDWEHRLIALYSTPWPGVSSVPG